jgi:hypothetical protein
MRRPVIDVEDSRILIFEFSKKMREPLLTIYRNSTIYIAVLKHGNNIISSKYFSFHHDMRSRCRVETSKREMKPAPNMPTSRGTLEPCFVASSSSPTSSHQEGVVLGNYGHKQNDSHSFRDESRSSCSGVYHCRRQP